MFVFLAAKICALLLIMGKLELLCLEDYFGTGNMLLIVSFPIIFR